MRRASCTHVVCIATCVVVHVTLCVTGWQRTIWCRKLQVLFHKRASDYRALLRKMSLKNTASYGFPLPCTHLFDAMQHMLKHTATATLCNTLQHSRMRNLSTGLVLGHIGPVFLYLLPWVSCLVLCCRSPPSFGFLLSFYICCPVSVSLSLFVFFGFFQVRPRLCLYGYDCRSVCFFLSFQTDLLFKNSNII